MKKIKRSFSLFLIIVLLTSLTYVSTVNGSYETYNLSWDNNLQNPNGVHWGTACNMNNWNVTSVVFNQVWESCIGFKVDFKINGSSVSPPINKYFTMYINDGNIWYKTDLNILISQKDTIYSFEPVFNKPKRVAAFFIVPTEYKSGNYEWTYTIDVHSISDGFADEVAVIDDFNFNFSQNQVTTFNENAREEYIYDRIVNFYNLYLIKEGKDYLLKGKYKATGSSVLRMIYYSDIYPFETYQTSNALVTVNGMALDQFNMSGDARGLNQSWYFPDGREFTVSLGSVKPSIISFEARHSGISYPRNEGAIKYVLTEITTCHNIDIGLNNKPVIHDTFPMQNGVFCESDHSLTPKITVNDEENQMLTCNLFIDNEMMPKEIKTITETSTAQEVSFNSINPSEFTQGTHLLKFIVSDGKTTAIKNISIKIDKSAPVIRKLNITSTQNSISIDGVAKDDIAGLNATAYRYTVGNITSNWTSNTSYTINSLIPNTKYTIKFEVRDTMGHIKTVQKAYYTKK